MYWLCCTNIFNGVALQRLNRELRVWQKLDHENIIPLYGTCMDFGHYVSMVCPWYEKGSIRHHLDTRGLELPLSHRLKLVRDFQHKLLQVLNRFRFDQLSDIAAGLSYRASYFTSSYVLRKPEVPLKSSM